MFLGRVVGELVSTLKHDALRRERLLWVERVDPDGRGLRPRRRILALDRVDAGPGDRVLVVDEGNSAAQVLGRPRGPVRTIIVGVVDQIQRDDGPVGPE
jgi:ethanolamine utilization protein EutN